MNKSMLYSDTYWALTSEAKELVNILSYHGWDIDLAIAKLEDLLPEDVLYGIECGGADWVDGDDF